VQGCSKCGACCKISSCEHLIKDSNTTFRCGLEFDMPFRCACSDGSAKPTEKSIGCSVVWEPIDG